MNNNYNISQIPRVPGGSMTGVILVLILLAILVYVKPSYFKFLFKSFLGNLIVAFIVIVLSVMDIKWGVGVAAVAVIVYQAFQISCVEVEGFETTCKSGCVPPTEPTGNCIESKDKQTLICPWECSTGPSNYSPSTCIYDSDCATCGDPVIFPNPITAPSTASSIGGSNSKAGSTSRGVSSARGLFPEGYPMPKASIWPENIIADFVKFQKIHNPNLRFDLDIIQKQASVGEVMELLKNGKWPWSSAVQEMYKQAIQENNIINTEPGASLENAQTVYNQAAILELLSWNSKEGSFLINGAIIGHTEDMPHNVNNLVRCGKDSETGKLSMQKIEYTGYNGIYGNMNSKVTPVNNSDLPSVVNGFKFLNGECNPCVALDDPANYSCPFSLNTGNGSDVSSVWQKLWGINAQGEPVAANNDNKSATTASKTTLSPETVTANFNKDKFPLLNELREEIMRGASLIDVSFKKPPTIDSSSSDAKISAVTGSSVPAILSNESHEKNAVYYGTKNSF
jgi:hypothetical protein